MQEVALDKPLVGRIREFFTKHPELHQKIWQRHCLCLTANLASYLRVQSFLV